MRHVGIAGKAGAGKDTIADYLVAHSGFVKLSMAGPLKAGLAAMGFPEPANRDDKEKVIPGFDFTWRQAAQELGTGWGRGLDPLIWLKLVERLIITSTQPVVISDIRFENEAALIRRLGGTMLFIQGRAADLGDAAAHISEVGVLFYPTRDKLIDNRGALKDTTAQVRHALELQG